MPPKKEEKKAEVPVGPVGDSSKFSYIALSSKPALAKIRVNTNCQTDLVVNWTRQQFIITLTAAISAAEV